MYCRLWVYNYMSLKKFSVENGCHLFINLEPKKLMI